MRRPSFPTVISLIALFVALGGTSYAVIKLPRNSVGSAQIKRNAVTGTKVRNHSIGPAELTARAAGRRGARGPAGPPGPAGVTSGPEPWKAFPFASAWTNWGDFHVTAAYRKDQLGKVHLRGLVTQRSPGPEIIGTLPAGYRPPGRVTFTVVMNSGTAVEAGRLNVDPDGNVMRSTPSSGEPDYTSFDSVSFWTDGPR